ncbi:MAG: hypothetical protein LIO92_03195 [Clostridiales bacterium]|nr:hypothetical protein [Clostridiales bacterium]
MKRVMAVYDVDLLYADRFAEHANEKDMTPFHVVAFASLEKLKAFAEKQTVEILLVGGNHPEEELAGLPVGQVIRLREDGKAGVETEELRENETKIPVIYKYQSSDSLMREVMTCYHVRDKKWLPGEVLKSRIIGVYSPINRCGKTGFAITLGQILAQNRKTLYLNLEECSGLSALTGITYKGSLSDLIYYYRQGVFDEGRLGSTLYQVGNLDYVPPAACPEDMEEIRSEEIAAFTAEIARNGRYEVIILDVGRLGKDAAMILELCGTIYVPVRDDCVSLAKAAEWRRGLADSGRGDLLERIRLLQLPVPADTGRVEGYLEQLRWGELGCYIQEMLRGAESGERVNG